MSLALQYIQCGSARGQREREKKMFISYGHKRIMIMNYREICLMGGFQITLVHKYANKILIPHTCIKHIHSHTLWLSLTQTCAHLLITISVSIYQSISTIAISIYLPIIPVSLHSVDLSICICIYSPIYLSVCMSQVLLKEYIHNLIPMKKINRQSNSYQENKSSMWILSS